MTAQVRPAPAGGGGGDHPDVDHATLTTVIAGLASEVTTARAAEAAAQAAAIAASQPVDADLTAIAALSTTAFGRGLLALADAAAGRTALALGTAATQNTGAFDAAGAAAAAQAASQPLDSDLTALAALATTAFGRSLLEAANATALRTLAGLVIGTDVQGFDAELAAIAGLTSAADRLPYFTGSGTASLATFTAAGRALVDDADAAAQLVTLGAAPLASPVFTGSPTVPDDPYDASGWNGSTGIPTKNALRDKIETLGAGTVVYPWKIDFDMFHAPAAGTGAWTSATYNASLYNGFRQNTGTLGDSQEWDVVVGAGTWTLDSLFYGLSDAGKETWALDDGAGSFTDLGIIDEYLASAANSSGSIAGFVVATTIRRRLRITTTAKNGSSSGHYLRLQHVQLRRTA